jgi:hypothetical protein
MERRRALFRHGCKRGLEGLSLSNWDRVVDLDVLRLKFKNPEATAMKREAEEDRR